MFSKVSQRKQGCGHPLGGGRYWIASARADLQRYREAEGLGSDLRTK